MLRTKHKLAAQSALEFLSTYAFIFLTISIVLVLLFAFSSIPKSVLPVQCSFYSGFQCLDAALVVNSTGVPQLLVIASDSEPGVVNVSSFSAFLNFHTSKSGYCVPSVATAGEKVYCTANFTGTVSLGSVYTGTFKVLANYCANSPANITATCPAGSQYTYGGSIRIQATKEVLANSYSNSYYLPINITNTQNSAVPAHFQQMIQFSPATYALEEAPNLGNIRFYSGSKELYSWCETNCTSSSASNAIFWVRLPQAIPPGQSMIIDMYFLPKNIGYSGVHAGEAPQLSPTYAEYDNGASVFNYYTNFAGTTLPNGWSVTEYGASPFTYTINNGMLLQTGSSGSAVIQYTATSFDLQTNILEAYGAMETNGCMEFGGGLLGNDAPCGGPNATGIGTDTNELYYWVRASGGAEPPFSPSIPVGTTLYMMSQWESDTTLYGELDYNNIDTTSSSFTPDTSLYISANIAERTVPNSEMFLQYVRVRDYPPNGVMPSYKLGTLASAA
ncbi:MAG: hypothetical protein QXR58_01230 [Candidatus Micrarchaeaceae archaeon]